MIHIPMAYEFRDKEFMEAPELEELVPRVCRWPELAELSDFEIRVLWKAEGSGQELAGKCRVLTGELAYFVGADWLIWLAADICREEEWDDDQVEALLYHQLCHCRVKEVKQDGEKVLVPAIRKHEIEMFLGEVERYGIWRRDYIKAKKTFETAPLPGFDAQEPRPARPRSSGRSAKDMRTVIITKDSPGVVAFRDRLKSEFGEENVRENVRVYTETGEVSDGE